jgi:hypothetical protein
MDERIRVPDATQNAAMLLALMWYYAGVGRRGKMVVLPTKIGWRCSVTSAAAGDGIIGKRNDPTETLCIRDCCLRKKAQLISTPTSSNCATASEFFITFIEGQGSARDTAENRKALQAAIIGAGGTRALFTRAANRLP